MECLHWLSGWYRLYCKCSHMADKNLLQVDPQWKAKTFRFQLLFGILVFYLFYHTRHKWYLQQGNGNSCELSWTQSPNVTMSIHCLKSCNCHGWYCCNWRNSLLLISHFSNKSQYRSNQQVLWLEFPNIFSKCSLH